MADVLEVNVYSPSLMTVTGTSSKFWIVASKTDAEAVVREGTAAVVLTIGPHEDLTRWTPSKKAGDWGVVQPYLKGAHAYIAVPKFVTVEAKARNAIAEVQAKLNTYGATSSTVELPAGETVSTCMAQGKSLDGLISDTIAAQMTPITGSTTADQLFHLVEDSFVLYESEEGEAFAVLKVGHKRAWVLGEKGGELDLSNWMIYNFRERTASVPAAADVNNAIAALVATAKSGTRQAKLFSRSGVDENNAMWLDLGARDDSHCVRIAEGDWDLFPEPGDGVFFRHSKLDPLPIPVKGSPRSVRDMVGSLVGVSTEDWALVQAWMVCYLMHHTVCPIAMFVGESDSGKSTSTRVVRFLLEGALSKGSKMKQEEDDVAVVLSKSRIALFNNVSHLSAEMSDLFCQVIDGMEYEKRQLHTTAGVSSLQISSSILFNGIDFGRMRTDLKTRVVMFELGPISNDARLDEHEIERRLQESHPEVLGHLLSLTAIVMEKFDDTVLEETPRMADFARTLATIDDIYGLERKSLARYMDSLTELAEQSLQDPLFRILRNMVMKEELWDQSRERYVLQAPLGDFQQQVNSASIDNSLRTQGALQVSTFKTVESFSGAMTRQATDFRRLGLELRKLGRTTINGKRDRYWELTYDPRERRD